MPTFFKCLPQDVNNKIIGLITGADKQNFAVLNKECCDVINNSDDQFFAYRRALRFMFACNFNDIAKVAEFLTQGVSPNTSIGKHSVLHSAACNGCTEVAKFLVAKGASLDAVDSDGNTPLMLAVLHNHAEVAKLLIENGARTDIKNVANETVMDLGGSVVNAIQSNDWAVALENEMRIFRRDL